jgi:hypothetical protein
MAEVDGYDLGLRSGPRLYAGQIYTDKTLPTDCGVIYMTRPVRIGGAETEGSAGTIVADGTRSVPVIVLCTSQRPLVGDVLVAHSVGGRWVAEKRGVGCTQCKIYPKDYWFETSSTLYGSFAVPMRYQGPIITVNPPDPPKATPTAPGWWVSDPFWTENPDGSSKMGLQFVMYCLSDDTFCVAIPFPDESIAVGWTCSSCEVLSPGGGTILCLHIESLEYDPFAMHVVNCTTNPCGEYSNGFFDYYISDPTPDDPPDLIQCGPAPIPKTGTMTFSWTNSSCGDNSMGMTFSVGHWLAIAAGCDGGGSFKIDVDFGCVGCKWNLKVSKTGGDTGEFCAYPAATPHALLGGGYTASPLFFRVTVDPTACPMLYNAGYTEFTLTAS